MGGHFLNRARLKICISDRAMKIDKFATHVSHMRTYGLFGPEDSFPFAHDQNRIDVIRKNCLIPILMTRNMTCGACSERRISGEENRE